MNKSEETIKRCARNAHRESCNSISH